MLEIGTGCGYQAAVLATLAIIVWHLYYVIVNPEFAPMSFTRPVTDSLEMRSLMVGVAARRSDAFLVHPTAAVICIAITVVSMKTVDIRIEHLLA